MKTIEFEGYSIQAENIAFITPVEVLKSGYGVEYGEFTIYFNGRQLIRYGGSSLIADNSREYKYTPDKVEAARAELIAKLEERPVDGNKTMADELLERAEKFIQNIEATSQSFQHKKHAGQWLSDYSELKGD